jgi:hypothetical protein
MDRLNARDAEIRCAAGISSFQPAAVVRTSPDRGSPSRPPVTSREEIVGDGGFTRASLRRSFDFLEPFDAADRRGSSFAAMPGGGVVKLLGYFVHSHSGIAVETSVSGRGRGKRFSFPTLANATDLRPCWPGFGELRTVPVPTKAE